MRFALFCIALLATANCMTLMEKYPVNFSQKRSILNLMVQIESHIKNGGPMDAITNILGDFKTEIENEQIAANELAEENAASCTEELTFRDNAIKEATLAVKEATTTLDGCVTQLARAELDLKAADNQLAASRQQLGQLERARIEESALYQTDIIAFKALHNGIGEALTMIDQMAAGQGSFVQVSKHINKVVLMAVQVKQLDGMAGLLTALVQLKDSSTDALFTKLRGLFTNFLNDNDTKHKECIAKEAEAVAHYNQVKARLSATIKKLIDQIDALHLEINELKKCVTMQNTILVAGKGKLNRNTNLRNSANAVCEASVRSHIQ